MARRRFEGRVQTPDLAAPEPIRPGPLKRDTYERAQREVVDTSDSKRLVQALGIAKGLVGPAISAIGKAQAERANAQREHDLRRWNHWLSTTEQTEQLDRIRSGQAPTSADPHVQAVIEKHYGFLTARRLAADVDKDIAERKIPFGTNQFNPDAYVIKRAVPHANTLVKSKHAMFAFRKALDHFRKDLAGRHTKALGIANTRKMESVAADTMDGALQQAYVNFGDADPSMEGVTVEQGTKGQRILDSLRSTLYRELGPRMSGGSLDIKYGRMDELLLDVLKEHAKDPRYAKTVMEILTANRKEIQLKGQKGKPQDLGALWNVYRHQAKMGEIHKTAKKALWNNFKTTTTQQITQGDVEALESRNGAFFTDVEIPFSKENTFKFSGSDRQEAALKAVAKKYRAEANSAGPVIKEIDLYLDNGEKHEEIAARLDGAVAGWINNQLDNSKEGKETRLALSQRIIELGTLYKYIHDKNPLATKTYFKPDTREFFDAYVTFIESNAHTPEQAVEMAQMVIENKDRFDVKISNKELKTAYDAVDVQDHSISWWNILGIGPDTDVSNKSEVESALKEYAMLQMRVSAMPADKALEKAAKVLSAHSVRVNGRVIMNQPGLVPTDSAHFQTMLKKVYKKYPIQLNDRYDVESHKDLTVIPNTNGIYTVVHKNGTHIVLRDLYSNSDASLEGITTEQEDRVGLDRSHSFHFKNILQLRRAAEKATIQEGMKLGRKARQNNKKKKAPPP